MTRLELAAMQVLEESSSGVLTPALKELEAALLEQLNSV